eukprot:1363282-Rhodomonas_salina.1
MGMKSGHPTPDRRSPVVVGMGMGVLNPPVGVVQAIVTWMRRGCDRDGAFTCSWPFNNSIYNGNVTGI